MKPCGCCEPSSPLTPVEIDNRAGLSAVAYRVGTYGSFRQAMFEALVRDPLLRSLRTRRDDDHSIALLDLWAAVADVLTFYQERYANETFLRTATERGSIARLSRLIGYRLRPGAAATTWLAFTLDAGKSLHIEPRLRVQSVPEQGERPQTFETVESIGASSQLNSLRVHAAPVASSPLAVGQQEAILHRARAAAIAASLVPGDRVVIFRDGGSASPEEKAVAQVRREEDRAVLRFSEPIRSTAWGPSLTLRAPLHELIGQAPVRELVAAVRGGSPERITASAAPEMVHERFPILEPIFHHPFELGGAPGLYKYKRKFGLFGRDAPTTSMKPLKDAAVVGGIRWELQDQQDFSYPAGSHIDLDGRYDGLAEGGRLLVADAEGVATLVTIDHTENAQASLGLHAATVTRLTVSPAIPRLDDRRRVVIYELADPPIDLWGWHYPNRIATGELYVSGRARSAHEGGGVEVGRTLARDGFAPGVVVMPSDLKVGRRVILTDARGEALTATISSPPRLTAADEGFCHLVLALDADGELDLDDDSAVLLGNVAAATHGETVQDELLGSGDASASFQSFALQKQPLTHVPAVTPAGVKSTLEMDANEVRWSETESLYGRGPRERVFAARSRDDGRTEVQAGDNRTGAAWPTGRGNVRASYRVGIGLAGRVRANALTTALGRPPGLNGVTNPLAAQGGADQDSPDDARKLAPRSVRTFERVVSIRDFEDLVTASGEVAKAQAIWVWDSFERTVHVTVAAQQGAILDPDTLARLTATLRSARDPNRPLHAANYSPVPIVVHANVEVQPDRERVAVEKAARAALTDALSFDRRDLGRPVHLSDVYRVLQDVDGVLDADVTELHRGASLAVVTQRLSSHVRVEPARPDRAHPGQVLPAELAMVRDPERDLVVASTGGADA